MAEKLMMHGARAKLTINGQIVAMGTGVDVNETYDVQRGETLDSIRTVELVVTRYTVSVSIDLITAVGKNPVEQGLLPQKGKSPDEHLQNLINHPDLQCVIEDRVTQKRLETVDGLTNTNFRRSYRKGAIAEGSMTFEAIVAKTAGEAP